MPDTARWIEVASAILLEEEPATARHLFTDQLLREFGARTGARVTLDLSSGALTIHGFPQDIAFDPQRWPYGVQTLEQSHPLLLHYVRTGSLQPRMLLGPGESPQMLPPVLVSLLTSLGIGFHQLGLPIRNEPERVFEGYVLVRDDPFPRWSLPRARALHDLVRGLESHLRLRAAAGTVAAAPAPDDEARLTPRERTILAMLAESRTAESIGRSLGISARTVHKHLENVYRKLGVSDRVAAVTSAQRRGLVEPGGEPGTRDGRLDPTDEVSAPR
ncbi:response regulator transcription factor [Mumia zhuanghuii]|nr:LuxR C-terminal-related transcriptional regulator [Mumia zhuanghuii]